MPRDDARAYAEGVRRGHALIAVRCDDDETDRVVDILDDDDVLDIDERQSAWRSEGWSHQGSGATDLGATATTSAGMLGGSALSGRDDLYAEGRGSDRDEVIPVAEEELHVGKREVSHGRVRIRSHVTERPVQEQVSLREEHVSVERRPVEGTMRTGSANNGDLFRERSIEMEERSEEAMVSKEARVVEEVVVRKDADRRTETVSDTVRKTEVEVDDERRSSGVPRTGTTDKNR
ncbi:YsnF/AvaK domain-containing protein [Microvirga sp. BT325]|uniref:YsnF/AvaK domain-containing protein n=2 Tax=Microvirga splendida TaxID=2795727 RepID=A0ABS0XWJ1_9HYPH|nr:YsnF/AvaK domain-containing protein [Microvirga splendida]